MQTTCFLSTPAKFLQALLRGNPKFTSEVRYNPVLAKWDEHYARFQNAHGHNNTSRPQHFFQAD